MNQPFTIVVWGKRCKKEDGNFKYIESNWMATDSLEEAKEKYQSLLSDPLVYTASICTPTESTDY